MSDTTNTKGTDQNQRDDSKAVENMSQTRAQLSDDVVSENDNNKINISSPVQPSLTNTGQDNDFVEADDYQSPTAAPSVSGEQSISGDMPDPESDDDTLENAQMMGQQLEEDSEHPEELDIARDVDNAEEYVRTH